MKKMRLTSKDLDGFKAADTTKVLHKLQRFVSAGAANIYFLFDFDRTLTTSRHTGDNTTTWQILHGLLPEHGKKTSNSIRDKYLALEIGGQLSPEDSHDFSTSVLNLHTTHGTTRQDIERAAKKIKLRDGSRELFALCKKANVPTVILSAGVRNIIELINSTHDIEPTVLVSIKLEFDNTGCVTGWDKDSLVLTHNKPEHFKQWVAHIHAERPFTVLIGDTIEDARIIEGDDNVLRIRVCDLKNGESEGRYRDESFAAGYDLIVEEDLAPVVSLTERLVQN